MRIGIMLRALGEKGGIGVYAENLTRELVAMDRTNHYVLLHRDPAGLGRFADFSHVTERLVRARGKLLWDQVAVPYACWKEGVDVLLHPKFSVPLFAPSRTVMVLHGAGWFIPEVKHFWSRSELLYARLMMPLYCRRASVVLSVSKITTDVFTRVLKLPEGKVRTVYFGPGRLFRAIGDRQLLEKIRNRYSLPDQFVLTLSGHDRGRRKNIGNIFAAYRRLRGEFRHKLVVVGRDCERFRLEYDLGGEEIWRDIVFPGWVPQSDLPAFYSLADAFLYPSKMEAFPIPITEALACGTPIVTSNRYGLQEIAADAALLVDPESPEEIAAALRRVLSDAELRASLSARALARAQLFTWEKCARETLRILESI